MQEPTTESLSTWLQLWHISTRIYADWSQLLQTIEMWRRSGQNVLWFSINLISDENPAKTTRKNTWWLISAVRWSLNRVQMTFSNTEVIESPSTRAWYDWSLSVVPSMASDEVKMQVKPKCRRMYCLVHTCISWTIWCVLILWLLMLSPAACISAG